MEKIYANIDIEFDGKLLYIGAKNTSGAGYEPENKEELIYYILDYVKDIVDKECEYDFEVFNKERNV